MPQFSFSGFGTLGFVSTNTDQAEYATSVRRDKFPSDVPSPLKISFQSSLIHLMPEVLIDSTNWRWNRKKSTSVGTATTTDAAII
jgi:hypothetical protein